MMSENLPGKAVVDFTPGNNHGGEYESGNADVHAFAGQGDMVLYLYSDADEATVYYVDLSNFVAGFDAMEVTVLGVAPGQGPGDSRSDIEMQQLEASEVYQDGILEANLDQGEIMQVIIRGIQPTDAFAPTLDAIEAAALVIDDEGPVFDEGPIIDDDPVHEDPFDDGGSGGGMEGLGLLLALLPLLLLAGMG